VIGSRLLTPMPPSAPMLESVTGSGVFWRMGDWSLEHAVGLEPAALLPEDGTPRGAALRRRRLIGRRWVRDLATARLGIASPVFASEAPGRKPRLIGGHGVDVSIAHSGSTLLVAVVADGRVGVDVEEEPFDAFDRPSLVRRMLAIEERAVLGALPVSARRRWLARAWTIKEATLKARGVGLAVDPRGVVPDARHFTAVDAATGPECAIVHLTAHGAVVSILRRSETTKPPPGGGGFFSWSG